MDEDIFRSLGNTRVATQTTSITKSGTRYTAKVKIYLKDYYDWKADNTGEYDYDDISHSMLDMAANILTN